MMRNRIRVTVLAVLLVCKAVFSIPSVINATIFESEISVVSANIWSLNNEPAWVSTFLDKIMSNRSCTLTLAVLAQHTNPTGHLYDLCSNNRSKIFHFHPRRFVAETSPYMKRNGNFKPIVNISLHNGTTVKVSCSYLHWTSAVGYVGCGLVDHVCDQINNHRTRMGLYSAYDDIAKCQNPARSYFVMESVKARKRANRPVRLSMCIYSGFRPLFGTKFYNLLEASIEYHRRLGVERFYIFDRNASHRSL